jgi:hypothetical protein
MKGSTRKIVFSLLLLLVGAILTLTLFLRKPTISVHGNLSQKDVADIVGTVKQDVWRQAFPDFSWVTLKRTPKAIWAVAISRVSEVTQTFENRAVVKGHFHLETRIGGPGFLLVGFGCDSWTMRKDSNGWAIQSRNRAQPSGTPHPVILPLQAGASFSESLTNESRLSLDRKP